MNHYYYQPLSFFMFLTVICFAVTFAVLYTGRTKFSHRRITIKFFLELPASLSTNENFLLLLSRFFAMVKPVAGTFISGSFPPFSGTGKKENFTVLNPYPIKNFATHYHLSQQ
jgi:hypothetical protein